MSKLLLLLKPAGGYGPNMVDAAESGFEDGSTVWGANNAALVNSTDQAKVGARSMKVTPDGGGVTLANLQRAKYGGDLVAGATYLLEAWVYIVAGWDGSNLAVRFQDYAGSTRVTVKTATTGSWVKVSDRLTPAADVVGQVYLISDSTPGAGKVLYVDELTIREAL